MKWKTAFEIGLPSYIGMIKSALKDPQYRPSIVSVEDVAIRGSQEGRVYKVQTKHYLSSGTFPIVDQGKKLIGGYSNESELVYSGSLPIIVFGDHTRNFKYLDFPFIIGADGVVLLKPGLMLNPRYFYYSLLDFQHIEKGYSRYYKQLSKHSIVLPLFQDQSSSLELQKNIASFLDDLEGNKHQGEYFDSIIEKKILDLQSIILSKGKLETELTHQQTLVKQLRQQLLQEAVQGKLSTDQPIPAESDLAKQYGKLWHASGAELLAHIRTEKAKLIKEKKIKADKPLPPITEEEMPFDLPEGWVWVRLGEVGILKRGKSKHRPRNDERLFEKGSIPFIQTGDVSKAKSNDDLITTVNAFYNEFGLRQSELQKKGTLCITIAANIAECGFLQFDACVPDSIVCFLGFDKELERYVYYFLKTAKEHLERFAPATAQKNINLGILNDLLIPLPPLQTQHRIVALLAAYQGLCASLEAQIHESLTLNGALLQEVLREALSEK